MLFSFGRSFSVLSYLLNDKIFNVCEKEKLLRRERIFLSNVFRKGEDLHSKAVKPETEVKENSSAGEKKLTTKEHNAQLAILLSEQKRRARQVQSQSQPPVYKRYPCLWPKF